MSKKIQPLLFVVFLRCGREDFQLHPPEQEGERLLGRPERERVEAGRGIWLQMEGGGGRGGETVGGVNEANQECLLHQGGRQETHHSLVQRWWGGGAPVGPAW